jgi:hypothetical protein
MTVEDYLAMSEADPRRMELVDGDVVVMSEPRLPQAAPARLRAQARGAVRRVRGR